MLGVFLACLPRSVRVAAALSFRVVIVNCTGVVRVNKSMGGGGVEGG